jgi:hypothetical protein
VASSFKPWVGSNACYSHSQKEECAMMIMSERHRKSCRSFLRGISISWILLSLSGSIYAAEPITLIDLNSRSGAEFGDSVTAIPDVDGDGKWDVAVNSRNLAVLADPPLSGNATIFNGVTGAKLGTLFPPFGADQSRMHFAERISGVSDVNGDGYGDVIIEDWDEDRTYIYDGRLQSVLQALPYPASDVAGLPDMNGDGRGDVVAGARQTYVLSGANGDPLHVLTSPHEQQDGYFGYRVAGVPDVNGDGKWDILVASFETPDGQPLAAGRVYLFDGASTQVLQTFVSPHPQQWGFFGESIAGLPDLNGDGAGEVLIYERDSAGTSPDYAGRAHLFNGNTGQLIHTFVSPNECVMGGFGYSLAAIPDVNGDGRCEILIGAPGESVRGVAGAGHAYLYDGATFRLMRILVSPTPQEGGSFGGSVAGLPDVNGDGRGDAVIGACEEDGYVGATYLLGVGRAYIFHLEPGPPASVGGVWTLYDSPAASFGFPTSGRGMRLPARTK